MATEHARPWGRAKLMLVGEGRVGKTALLDSLRNRAFKHTDSTAGIATCDVETTDVHNWQTVEETEFEKAVAQMVADLRNAEDCVAAALRQLTIAGGAAKEEEELRQAVTNAEKLGLRRSDSPPLSEAAQLLDRRRAERMLSDALHRYKEDDPDAAERVRFAVEMAMRLGLQKGKHADLDRALDFLASHPERRPERRPEPAATVGSSQPEQHAPRPQRHRPDEPARSAGAVCLSLPLQPLKPTNT